MSQEQTSPGEPLLRVEGLVVKYGPATAISGLSMSVGVGGTIALLGANGAGKSSTARALAGLVPIAGGKIWFGDVDITHVSAHRRRRLGLAYLPEERGIFRTLSVIDNLRMGVRWAGDKGQRNDGIAYGLELFPRLAERRNQIAGLLSGGEQQMLALARSLAVKPRLLMGDELSLGLSPQMVDTVFGALEVARGNGTAVLLIEQFVHRALGLADNALILRKGQAVWTGAAENAKDEVLLRYLEDTTELLTN